MAGMKFDGEKLRYHLIDRSANAWLAAVLTYGAEKYTQHGTCTCGANSAGQSVSTSKRSASAATATTSIFEAPTRSTHNDSATTHESGPNGIQGRSSSTNRSGFNESKSSKKTLRDEDISTRRRSMDFRPTPTSGWLPMGAPSAVQPNAYVSTTTTIPGESEGASATSATSVLASSSARTNGSTGHSPTCGWHKLTNGEENWRQVDGWRERYYSALMRHVEAWRNGEQYDPESTLPHLCHAFFCVMCLLGMDSPDTRDLPERLAHAVKIAREMRAKRGSVEAAEASK